MLNEPGLVKTAVSLYEHLNTPRALTAYIMVKYNEWDSLTTLSSDPRNYIDTSIGAEKFRRDAQASNFLRKSPLIRIKGLDTTAAARALFYECEVQCFETNYTLQSLQLTRNTSSQTKFEFRLQSILDRSREIAGRILGKIPDDIMGRFGPGTSAEMKGSTYTTVADKMWVTPTATQPCMDIFQWMLDRTHWGTTRVLECLPLPRNARGDRYTTVNKTARVKRGICIQPLGNLFVQLAIGGYMKRKLGAVGLHVAKTADRSFANGCPEVLRLVNPPLDGQFHHKRMAREGSVAGGKWVTIDLSNASDTVATELVKWVIPQDWFDLLNACRTPYTEIEGTNHLLSKFSAMGNGFTFELETLVFAAILAAACDLKVGDNLFVYGDDIVIPKEQGRNALAALKACGFTPNEKKSYIEGPFRESCGGDYFEGFDVRSVYADSEFTTPLEWIALHNNLRSKWGPGPHLKRIVDCIPSRLRSFGPTHLGDQCLHGRYKARKSKRGYDVVSVVVPSTLKVPLDRWSTEMHLSVALYGGARGIGGCRSRQYLTPRAEPTGFRMRLASVS